LHRLLLSGLVAIGVAVAAMPSATAQRFTEAAAAGAIGNGKRTQQSYSRLSPRARELDRPDPGAGELLPHHARGRGGGEGACPPREPSDPLSPAGLGVAPAKGRRRAQRRARRRGRDQSAGGYPLHGLPLSGASGSVSRARNCAQARRTKGARVSQAGGRAASVVRGAPKADAAMPAKTRIVVVVAAAPAAILAGGMSWQWLAGRTTPWARFLGTEAPAIAFVASDAVPTPLRAPSATRPAAAARARAIDAAEFLCASRRRQRDQQVLDQIVRMLEAA